MRDDWMKWDTLMGHELVLQLTLLSGNIWDAGLSIIMKVTVSNQ